jgi:DNA (cytosine-5)-methyltransferase 1
MIRIIGLVEPKIFLFENVRGILTGRWTSSGKKGEIFRSVFKDFQDKLGDSYHLRWELIKSSSYGIPQNRPRLFMVGLHKSLNFCKKKEKDLAVSFEIILEDMKNDDLPLKKGYGVDDEFFPKKCDEKAPGPKELLDDLVDSKMDYNNLIPVDRYKDDDNRFETTHYLKKAKKPIQQKMRFHKGEEEVSLTEQVYSRHSERIIKKFWHMINNKGEIPPGDRTNKFAQKVLPEEWKDNHPTITVTSLPDDYVHYSQPRILTVREWARLQTFPDWYEFKGIRTTGGARRSGNPDSTADQIETPKYTQVGNAVPVELARQIGDHFKTLLA